MNQVDTTPAPQSYAARLLYPTIAVLLFVLTAIGFQQFYLHGRAASGRELALPVKSLLIVHGVAMTMWVALFLVQPVLVVSNNRRAHRSFGIFGAALAICIVVLGLWTTVAITRVAPDVVRFGLRRDQFMAIQFNSMLTFGGLVAIGVWNRHRPEIHRPMMLLATLAVMGAVTSRITGLRNLQASTIGGGLFGPNFIVLVIGVLFLATKTAVTRSFDRWFAGGLATLAAISMLAMKVASTATWDRIAIYLRG